MPRFSFTAIDAGGKERTGLVEAPSVDLASSQIKSMGLFPTKLVKDSGDRTGKKAIIAKAINAGAAPRKKRPIVIGRPINQKGLTQFTRQLSILLESGLPLLRSLEVLSRQQKKAAPKMVIDELADNIRSGNTFSEGLERHPKVFNRLYVNMVRAGEAGGVLDVVLARLSHFMEKAEKIKGRVRAAMVYPIIVMLVAVSILTGLLTFVVPKFQLIFDDMLKGASLPLLTQIVIDVSDFVKSHFGLTLGGIIGFVILMRIGRRTRLGAFMVDWSLINLPPLGELFRKASVSRFTRTFGTLLASGVPILQALQITRETSGNTILMKAIDVVHDRVKEGEGIAGPLEGTGVFPAMVTSMIEVGEETGQLHDMLNRIADTYDEEVDNTVAGLTSIIEPLMIVFLAIVVGTIVIALFLPIVRIIQQLS
ncbi:MAG: type II secretion system F family protein [Verrucomicrobia bacterium]|nr:MAG: type II secretion system F family protein [Verrucomicrobiota bacterium]